MIQRKNERSIRSRKRRSSNELLAEENQERRVKSSDRPGIKKKRRKGIKLDRRIVIGIIAVIVLAIAIPTIMFLTRKVKSKVKIEAGTQITGVDYFLKKPGTKASMTTDLSKIDFNKPGEYEVKVKVDGRDYKSKLIIEDTIAPTADVVNQDIDADTTLKAKDFVANVRDANKVSISFKKKPKFHKPGTYTVTIKLEDSAGNTTEQDAILNIGDIRVNYKREAGLGALDISEFLIDKSVKAEFVTDVSKIDMSSMGTYSIVIKSGDETYISTLDIVDRLAPVATVVERSVGVEQDIPASAFVTDIRDSSEVSVSYLKPPSFATEGESEEVHIALTDSEGNRSAVTTVANIINDTEAPKVSGDKISVYVGSKISYKRAVKVEDNTDPDPKIEVDTTAINIDKVGNYKALYTITDYAGNSTTFDLTVSILEKPTEEITEANVNELAEKVLNDIVKDNMNLKEKAKAIYDWCRSEISYTGTSDKTNWTIGAYQGFTTGAGDCYTYFATAKAMLTKSGIPNIDVEKSDTSHSRHYWSLINLGYGWYHFDSTPRVGGGDNFFMVTDAFIKAYSKKNDNSHVWDASKYPATPEVDAEDAAEAAGGEEEAEKNVKNVTVDGTSGDAAQDETPKDESDNSDA